MRAMSSSSSAIRSQAWTVRASWLVSPFDPTQRPSVWRECSDCGVLDPDTQSLVVLVGIDALAALDAPTLRRAS
jgi:hypothetical protein